MSDFRHPPQHRPPEKQPHRALAVTLLVIGGILVLCGCSTFIVGAANGSSGDAMDSLRGDSVAMATYLVWQLGCPFIGLVLMAVGGYLALRRRG